MKTGRHQKILEIISEHPVETQDEIIALLKEAGYKATQATISRDIKDLRLVKTLGSDGKYRYISDTGRDPDLRGGFNRLFAGSVRSVEQAQNLVVIKTLSGTANAVCAAMDSDENPAVVGTIAGDDTIFVACRTSEDAAALTATLKLTLR